MALAFSLRQGCCLLMLLLCSFLIPFDEAKGYGAIAESTYSYTSGRTTYSGYAYGYVAARPTVEEAQRQAIESCNEAKQDKPGQCRVLSTFEDQCLAFARDSRGEGYLARGWAIATQRSDAEQRAMENCRRSGGASYCELRRTVCDAKPPPPPPANRPAPPPQPPEPAVASVNSQAIEEATQAVRTATYVTIGVTVTSTIAIAVTVFWAWYRVSYLQQSIARMKAGVTGIFVPSARENRRGGTQISPAAGGRDRYALVPKGGGRELVLSSGRLRGSGVIVGRHSSCDVAINDDRASGRHARFYLDPSGGLRVEDLKSSNGTWRNGERVQDASLRDGDVLRLGNSEFTLRS